VTPSICTVRVCGPFDEPDDLEELLPQPLAANPASSNAAASQREHRSERYTVSRPFVSERRR
jgi:hypothetical protein